MVATADEVIAEARSWIGTPYHHMAYVKGRNGGVDCGMIVIGVYSALGFWPFFDPRPYPRQFHMHRQEEWYRNLVRDRFDQIDEPIPGCVALWKIGRIFSHGSIVTHWPRAVHAIASANMVLEDNNVNLTVLKDIPVEFYSPWRNA